MLYTPVLVAVTGVAVEAMAILESIHWVKRSAFPFRIDEGLCSFLRVPECSVLVLSFDLVSWTETLAEQAVNFNSI